MDVHSANLKGQQYPFALNASVEANDGDASFLSLKNDGSNVLASLFPQDFTVISKLPVPEQNRTIYFLVNPQTGASQIGEVLDGVYEDKTDSVGFGACEDCPIEGRVEQTPLEKTTQTPYLSYYKLAENVCFNFSINHPVRARYKITDCSLNIYFTDRLNQRRFLYFDYEGGDTRGHLRVQDRFKEVTGYDDCNEPIYGTELDCNKLNYHPSYSIPTFKSINLATGGSLKAGTVQFLIGYSDELSVPMTNYFPPSNPFPIFSKQITFETNYTTDKAVKVVLEGLDQSFLFSHYNVVVAETIDNYTEFKLLGTYPVTQTSFVYSGNEPSLKKLTPDDVFFRREFFKTAGNVTSANDYLFFSDLEKWSRPNLQRAALGVKLYWQTVAIREDVYRDPRNTDRFRSNMRDEVYPYGIEYISEVGEVLGTYHIPGPSKQYLLDNYGIDVSTSVSNDDAIQRDVCAEQPTNCCEEPVSTTLAGTISIVCPDKNCTEQMENSVTVTFPTPTTQPIRLLFGEIVDTANGNFASGFDIFTMPSDTVANPGISNPQIPYYIDVPVGSTSFTKALPDRLSDNEFYKYWACHSCLSPLRDVYVKVDSPANLQGAFTTTDSYTLHNVDVTVVAPDPDPDCDPCLPEAKENWEVYNTAVVVGMPHEETTDCEDGKVWEWGEFSYWESTERYPNNEEMFGPLCGQPIRHHKFPDSTVTHIHDSKDGSKGFKDSNMVFPIGVSVDHQSVIDSLDQAVSDGIISAADRARITQYRIVRGNRVGHKSVVAKGLLYDMWSYDKFGNKYYYPNYPYNDLRQDWFISNSEETYKRGNNSSGIPNTLSRSGRYTFHSPDVHFVNREIGTELKLETEEYGESEGFFSHCEEQAKYKFLSTAAMTLALATGIAAAFSKEKERKCKTVVLKQDTTLGVTAGTTTGSLGLVAPTQITDYGELSGQPDLLSAATNVTAGEVHKTSCKGTTFQLLNPLSGNPAGLFLQQAIYLGIIGMHEMRIMQDLIKALIPLKNFAIQYNSAGKYTNYKTVPNSGNKIRSLLRSAYLEPIIQLINEAVDKTATSFTNTYINNYHRERSVYLRIDSSKQLPAPTVQDNSRFDMNEAGLDQDDLGKKVYRTISSHYASIKNYIPDQYGKLSDIVYLPTGSKTFKLSATYPLDKRGIYSGDTFITRFALKRKMPFFIQTRFRTADEADVQYSELGNAGFPNFYFNTEKALMERLSGNTFGGAIWEMATDLLGVANSRLDAKKNKAFYQSGFIHLYNYGIPYFLCESDINVDYRYGQNNAERDFYPHNQDLQNWLQEKNVPITEDNYYFYNNTYSKQNKEDFVAPQVRSVDKACSIELPSTAIQSEKDEIHRKVDKWLIFKPNNREDFPVQNGRIIGLDGIENDKVLVRFENGTKVFGAYATLQTSEGDVQVGNGGVFASRPKDFSVTSLGYAGTQHTDLLSTEFGHIWVDAKRGNIFNLGPNASSMDELAKDGMKAWFKENLPFQIAKDFPNFPLRHLDNNYKGIGIALSFDQRFNRFFLTKLDYKCLDKTITYDPATGLFKKGATTVSLNDSKYFCDRSFTVSYNFATKSWVSYHSFKPRFYVDTNDYIYSGIEGSVWAHNVTNKSYQVYYGKLEPFVVSLVSSPMLLNGVLNSVSYHSEVIRYHNEYDKFYNRNITFNKALIFNESQTSGLLHLVPREEEDLFASIQYPKVLGDTQEILVTRDRDLWVFNQFWDTANSQQNNLPLFNYKCNNCEKELNLKALNYYKPDILKAKIRGKQTKIELINDAHSNYQFIFHFLNQQKQLY